MEIILLQDVKSLGKEGDKVKVKDGYARNFIIPKKLGVPATAAAEKTLDAKKKKAERLIRESKIAAEAASAKLSQISLTISMESGVSDTLFGTLTPDMIFHALQHEGVQVDKKCIQIPEHINKLGVYNIEIKLHPEVKTELRVWVVKK